MVIQSENSQQTEIELQSATLELARAHGDFYATVIDLLENSELNSNSSDFANLKKAAKHISDQSPTIQEAYRSGMRAVLAGLKTEQQKIDQLRLQKNQPIKQVLVDLLLRAPGDPHQVFLRQTFEQSIQTNPSTLDQIDLVTFAPGLYALQAEKKLIKSLSPWDGWQYNNVLSKELGQMIQFLILPKNAEIDDPNRTVLHHELHHFVWNCLKQHGNITTAIVVDDDIASIKNKLRQAGHFHPFTFPEKTTGNEVSTAFETFRNELVGYILSYKIGGFPPISNIAESMTHVGLDLRPEERLDLEANKLAAETLKSISEMISEMQGKAGNTNPNLERLFIYPAMKAKCFTELLAMCQNIHDDFMST